jgi:hypothetical protein
MMYSSLIRPLLFKLPAEDAHNVALNGMKLAARSGLATGLLRAAVGAVPSAPVAKAFTITFASSM